MKILFILHYPPPVHGSSVVGGFIKNSKIINSTYECHYINLGTSASVEDIGRTSLSKVARYFLLIWQVNKQVITFKPDLCYLTPTSRGPGFYKDLPVIAMLKVFGVKTIFHYHNKGVKSQQNHFIDNLFYRFAFRKANIILLSKLLYPDIQKYVPENKVYYCANGMPDQEDKRQKTKDKSTDSVVEILFLSHLIESKGVFVLVEALKMLKDENFDFHCTMIGGECDISDRQLKYRVGEAVLENSILVKGKKFGEGKQKALETADIFVLPTYYHNECMPLVLLEAMQHSLPVVSTFEGAIPDVVEDCVTGFLVPQKDAVALAEKLELLIKNPELRKKMGAAGRKKYEKEFTLTTFEMRMVEILKELMFIR